jgi:hypothetical protein
MDEIAEDLEDEARRHISKIQYWHVIKLRGRNQSDFSQLKIGTGPQLMMRKELKRDGQNILRIC